MTKGDIYTKELIERILKEGTYDINPRPHYEDIYYNAVYDEKTNTIITEENEVIELNKKSKVVKYDKEKVVVHTPAHTISINNPGLLQYDLSKNETPLITLRPIAVKAAIAEILWIYQKESTDLVEFDELLNKRTWDDNKPLSENEINNWWKQWALRDKDGNYLLNEKNHPYIGSTYGEIVRKHKLVRNKLKEMHENPESRYHIINLWQYEDFEKPHGLKPCAFMTMWNIRHGQDHNDYLDMKLVQRSSDFLTAGCINQVQYVTLQLLFAKHLGIKPGVFTWDVTNIQIYDRHMIQADELLNRQSVECRPEIVVNENVNNFYDFIVDDIKIKDYPRELIKKKNPQMKFDLGI